MRITAAESIERLPELIPEIGSHIEHTALSVLGVRRLHALGVNCGHKAAYGIDPLIA
ncbi:hypothetical protein [Pseudomonas sp. PDM13]|uniref:hypothetical protein n=1 Tax=Pseudomonas sp. PDM13 TaxID=2769255 RepID=UPI0021DF703C|nr:hypothetical protein [Pseudomonas sp. PDM13]MCU9948910.1 hypothetical protein [Pseudomonas sp. PDM13]